MESERFEEFSIQISYIYKEIQKLKAGFVESDFKDIKSVHTFWLYLLLKNPQGLYCSEIAEKSFSNRSLVSREINLLIDLDLIKPLSEAGNSRRYGTRYVLTEAGMKYAKKVQLIAANIQKQLNEGITCEELTTFYKVLDKLHSNFSSLSIKNVDK